MSNPISLSSYSTLGSPNIPPIQPGISPSEDVPIRNPVLVLDSGLKKEGNFLFYPKSTKPERPGREASYMAMPQSPPAATAKCVSEALLDVPATAKLPAECSCVSDLSQHPVKQRKIQPLLSAVHTEESCTCCGCFKPLSLRVVCEATISEAEMLKIC